VLSLKMQAEMRLGLLGGLGADDDKDTAPDLSGARHAIDMLAMLSEKTRGNLSLEEGRLIENSLTELRFRFVQTAEVVHKEKAQKEKAEKEKAEKEKAQKDQAPAEQIDTPPPDASGSAAGS